MKFLIKYSTSEDCVVLIDAASAEAAVKKFDRAHSDYEYQTFEVAEVKFTATFKKRTTLVKVEE